jgi:hypothetical protein
VNEFLYESKKNYATAIPVRKHTYTFLLTHGAEPFLRRSQMCSFSRISQRFMEPEGSLSCSQELSTGPYPEPDHSNPYHPTLSILILSTHLCLHLPSGLFPSGVPPISYMHSSPPFVLHALPLPHPP